MALIGQMSGSLTHLTDGSSYLVAGTNVTITTGTNASVTIAASSASPAGSDTQVQFNDGGSFGGDSGLVFNKSTDVLTVTKLGAFTAAGAIDFDNQNMTNVDVDSGAIDGTTIGAASAAAGTFTTLVADGGTISALSSSYIVPASTQNDILITSGNHPAEATGNDVFLFVTGVVGTQGTTTKGTALFAGDLVTSGTLLATNVTIGNDLTVADDALFTSDGAKLSFGADAEVTLTHVHNTGLLLSDDSGVGTTKLMFGDSATFVQQQADGQLGIDADSVINITAPTVDIDASTEVNISGQATVAGTLLVAEDIQHSGDTDTKVSLTDDQVAISAGGVTGIVLSEGDEDLLILGGNGTQSDKFSQVLILSGGAPGSYQENNAGDVSFYVSGAIQSLDGNSGGASVFGGDVAISGTLAALDVLEAAHITGSITQTAEGTSFLAAGSNVTITSGSSGQIVIASSGGSTDPAGSNTQVQFNDGGSFGGDAQLTFNKNTNNLAAQSITVSEYVTASLFVQYDGEPFNFGDGNIEVDSSDVGFFVSGSKTAAGASAPAHPKHAVFGGDLLVSGVIRGGYLAGIGTSLLGIKAGVTTIGAGTIPLSSAQGGPGTDVGFFVSGSVESNANVATALFGGKVKTSGSILPGVDNTIDLGASTNRWANIYTGDLHLKNDRGDWTIIEEANYLSLRNNANGKLYKILMEEISE